MKALIIASPWIDYILNGQKTWEMRSTHTKIRGPIYLVKKGSGHIYAEVNLVQSLGPLSLDEIKANQKKHCIKEIPNPFKWNYAWVLQDLKVFDAPQKYHHPQGAVIWVNIDKNTQ